MVVCKFYQQGTCKFGDKCRNEHISASSQNQNRFGVFAGFAGSDQRNAGFSGGPSNGNRFGQNSNTGQRFGQSRELPYNLDAKIIETDLKNDRPQWPISSYGPNKDVPRLLFAGELEQSPEEMRYRYYLAKAQGSEESGKQVEALAARKMNETVDAALKDIPAVIDFIIKGADEHPNRQDIIRATSAPQNVGLTPAFGKPAFGQPSLGVAPTQSGNPFGAPSNSAFGQPSSAAASSPFGQASALSQRPTFGQPAFGQPSAPAFGQPSSISRSSPFGPPAQTQPSPFGQVSSPPAQVSPFGQVGAAPVAGSPFGQGAAAQPSPFGQASAASGRSPFGQATAPPTQHSAFGQPAALGSQPSPFGQATAAVQQSSPFGQIGQTSNQSTPFGQPAQSVGAVNPFGQASQPATSNPFGQPNTPINQQQGTAQALGDGGPPGGQSYDPPDEAYGGKEAEFKKAYDYFLKNGAFEGGVIPLVAPKKDWVFKQ